MRIQPASSVRRRSRSGSRNRIKIKVNQHQSTSKSKRRTRVSAPHTYFELPSWSASPVRLNVTESCTGCGCDLAGGLGGVFTGPCHTGACPKTFSTRLIVAGCTALTIEVSPQLDSSAAPTVTLDTRLHDSAARRKCLALNRLKSSAIIRFHQT